MFNLSWIQNVSVFGIILHYYYNKNHYKMHKYLTNKFANLVAHLAIVSFERFSLLLSIIIIRPKFTQTEDTSESMAHKKFDKDLLSENK